MTNVLSALESQLEDLAIQVQSMQSAKVSGQDAQPSKNKKGPIKEEILKILKGILVKEP